MKKRKKAYQLTDCNTWADCAFVVFAESVAKAKSLGLRLFRLEDYDIEYIDIRAVRLPLLDRFNKGEEEIDYDNLEVQGILVKEYGWGGFHYAYE